MSTPNPDIDATIRGMQECVDALDAPRGALDNLMRRHPGVVFAEPGLWSVIAHARDALATAAERQRVALAAWVREHDTAPAPTLDEVIAAFEAVKRERGRIIARHDRAADGSEAKRNADAALGRINGVCRDYEQRIAAILDAEEAAS